MKESGKVRITAAQIENAVETFLKKPPNEKVKEILRQISFNPNLLISTINVLETGEVLCSDLPIDIDQTPSALDLSGVFLRKHERYRIKNTLWSRILNEYLTPQHVGQQFSVVGDWDRAIKYFGKAVLKDHSNLNFEIFAIVINAINSINLKSPSEITSYAFRFVATGIEAAFPGSELILYQIVDAQLVRLCPQDITYEFSCFELSDITIPEVEALYGPSYSFATTSIGSCFLIPLRSDRQSRPIGLVVIRDFAKDSSLYYQREVVNQIIVFLKQVAQTIERKLRFAELLEKLDREAEIREKTAKIATGLIHDI
jgi:hypothetical protein